MSYTVYGVSCPVSVLSEVSMFQESDKAILGRKIRVNFTDAAGKEIEATIPLDHAYANFVLKVTESARAHTYYSTKPVQKSCQFWLFGF